MLPKNKITLSSGARPSRRRASRVVNAVSGTVRLMPKGITINLVIPNPKFGNQFRFHSVSVDKNVVAHPILESQRPAVPPGIRPIALAFVDVVRGERDFFSKQACNTASI